MISTEDEREVFINELRKADLEKPLVATFEVYRKKRSLKQNSTLWMWMNIIKAETEYDPKEIYQFFCQRKLPWVSKKFWDEPAMIAGGSSKLSTIEFNDFLREIHQFCAEQGIDLPWPDDPDWEEAYIKYGPVE